MKLHVLVINLFYRVEIGSNCVLGGGGGGRGP